MPLFSKAASAECSALPHSDCSSDLAGLCQITAQGSGPHAAAARSNVNAFERHQLMVNALAAK